MKEKNLQLERLVFFCDAVVAIAITLLVFNLKLDRPAGAHLHFSDLRGIWKKLIAFLLSFLNVAIFWTIHHRFFAYIIKADTKLLRYNLCWLFFIVIIPFTASLVSDYLEDPSAVFVYSLNMFLVTFFQNQIWDYVAIRPDFLKSDVGPSTIYYYRQACNIAMVNGLMAMGISFISPLAAFVLLFLRLPMINLSRKIFRQAEKIADLDA